MAHNTSPTSAPEKGDQHCVVDPVLSNVHRGPVWDKSRISARVDGFSHPHHEGQSRLWWLVWVNYDLAFHRLAAATGNTQ